MRQSLITTAVAGLFAATSEAVTSGAAAAPVALIVVPSEDSKVSYHFKKEKIKNEKGEKIGEGKKLPSVEGNIPVPNAEGVLKIVEAGGKAWELLQEVMKDAVFTQGRAMIDAWREANPDKEVPAGVLDSSKLAWDFIANLPKSERRGLGISDEEWEDFFSDYREVMPKATGKDADRIEKHVAIYKKKFSSVRNDKKALAVLNDMLALYATSTSNMEEVEKVYDYLKKRVEALLQEEEKVLAEAL